MLNQAKTGVLQLRRPAPVSIDDQMRKCVAFLGYPDTTPGKGGIHCIGTGFFIEHSGALYLITAKHISAELGKDPFLIRLNKHDGTSENLPTDSVDWIEHSDPTVDVAAVAVGIENPLAYDVRCMSSAVHVFKPGEFEKSNIGVGNFTYTVGLFRLLSGEKRNLPICHFGTIAMLPGDERIPVVDWTDLDGERRLFVDGYLVESQSLDGLSGSPVFVRPELGLDFSKQMIPNPDNPMPDIKPKISAVRDVVKLLGLWQGSWDAPPDEVLAVQTGDDVRVSVGMGIVVPYERIIEVLEMPKAKAHRDQVIASRQMPAARLDSVAKRAVAKSSLPAIDENPNHLEDFTRLVDVAARKKPKN